MKADDGLITLKNKIKDMTWSVYEGGYVAWVPIKGPIEIGSKF